MNKFISKLIYGKNDFLLLINYIVLFNFKFNSMKIDKKYLIFLLLFIYSCDKKSFPVDDTTDTTIIFNKNIYVVNDSVKGELLFFENFQKWARDGYQQSVLQNCETDLMKSTNTVSFLTTTKTVVYDSITINYAMIDYAVNPECGNAAGTSTATSDVSVGYVALQSPIFYTCGHYSKGYIETSVIPSVSYVDFSISYGDNSKNFYVGGLSLYKITSNSDTVKIGTYKPYDYSAGAKFSIKIDDKNVILRFKAEKNAYKDLVTNETPPVVNRSVRLHDLKVWRKK